MFAVFHFAIKKPGQKKKASNDGKMVGMVISARRCELGEIAALRKEYVQEMGCQVIHDSIHWRPGWSREFLLDIDGSAAGYGSVAVGGPWKESHALYEFYVRDGFRQQMFDMFEVLVAGCDAKMIETQTNDRTLTTMMITFARNVRAEAILFEDGLETRLQPQGASFRPAAEQDVELLLAAELDDTAGWVVTCDGSIAGAGGVLYHYNRPYGDVYMKIAEPFRNRGLGAYLVQELKRACREEGSRPAARCNVKNAASRKTLQKAGFIPCGNLVVGEIGKVFEIEKLI